MQAPWLGESGRGFPKPLGRCNGGRVLVFAFTNESRRPAGPMRWRWLPLAPPLHTAFRADCSKRGTAHGWIQAQNYVATHRYIRTRLCPSVWVFAGQSSNEISCVCTCVCPWTATDDRRLTTGDPLLSLTPGHPTPPGRGPSRHPPLNKQVTHFHFLWTC